MTDQPKRPDDRFADLPEVERGDSPYPEIREEDSPYPAISPQDYMHRILRYQLDEKLGEIQAALGLTDLAMLEVVTHWTQHKIRALRDAEVEDAQLEEEGPVSDGGYPVGP